MELMINNGEEWVLFVDLLFDRVEGADERLRKTVKLCSNFAARLWFVIVALYAFDLVIDPKDDPVTTYVLDHAYEYLVFTCFKVGDVYKNMADLWMKATTHHELASAHSVVAGHHADL